uniref:BLOC-1-related complex subunit 7 n=1 Tax=Clastoptera arizonana TaxID=38151 RepID=A0A1B6DYN9_9HEMI
MASASSSSARSLFGESKSRLADRVQVNVNNIASLVRQIQRGSKSSEILTHSSRNFAALEQAIDNTENNIKKLELIATNLKYHQDSISSNSYLMEEVKEQVQAMQR